MAIIVRKGRTKRKFGRKGNIYSLNNNPIVFIVMVAAMILFTAISTEASDDLLSKRPKRPSVISQKNLIEARDENGVHSIVPHHIYSNENSNLNSVGLSESAGPNDGTGLHTDVGKVLQGPNVCTKQEP